MSENSKKNYINLYANDKFRNKEYKQIQRKLAKTDDNVSRWFRRKVREELEKP